MSIAIIGSCPQMTCYDVPNSPTSNTHIRLGNCNQVFLVHDKSKLAKSNKHKNYNKNKLLI